MSTPVSADHPPDLGSAALPAFLLRPSLQSNQELSRNEYNHNRAADRHDATCQSRSAKGVEWRGRRDIFDLLEKLVFIQIR